MNILARRLARIEARDRHAARVAHPAFQTFDPLDELVAICDELDLLADLDALPVVSHQPREHAVPCQIPGHRHMTFAYTARCTDPV